MMWWGEGSLNVGMWTAMGLMMVVFWAAVIALGLWVVGEHRSRQAALPRRASPARADEELAERFARGEIDEAQFTRARRILHSERTD